MVRQEKQYIGLFYNHNLVAYSNTSLLLLSV